LFELVLQSLIESAAAGNDTYIDPEALNTANNAVNTGSMSSYAGDADIESAIESSSERYGVDDDLIKSEIKQESGFNQYAVSKAGAQGLMQLMPKTAESLGVDNPFDVLENIDGGTRYLRNLLDAFGGDKKLALAAYNGGIGRMQRLGVDTENEIDRMPKETQNYVEKVIANYQKYKSSDK
jgi:soluble lytic murein transglycosylase-like protein